MMSLETRPSLVCWSIEEFDEVPLVLALSDAR